MTLLDTVRYKPPTLPPPKDIDERIQRIHSFVTRIANGDPPTTIVMGLGVFSEWYYYCEERELNHLKWRGVQILVTQAKQEHKLLAVTYHPEQEKLTFKNEGKI